MVKGLVIFFTAFLVGCDGPHWWYLLDSQGKEFPIGYTSLEKCSQAKIELGIKGLCVYH